MPLQTDDTHIPYSFLSTDGKQQLSDCHLSINANITGEDIMLKTKTDTSTKISDTIKLHIYIPMVNTCVPLSRLSWIIFLKNAP